MSIGLQIALVAATVLSSLVAGFLFAFAVVVMPGFAKLEDKDYLRAYQEVDGVIQRGQPLFGLVWVGSALALLVSLFLGFGQLVGSQQGLLMIAVAVFILGVQLPTILVNIPLNNAVKSLDLAGIDAAESRAARERFEGRWNRWNVIRTVLATLTTALLVVLLTLN